MSLSLRLNLLIAAAMALIFLAGAAVSVRNARHSVEEEVQASVHLALQLIEAGYAEAQAAGRPLPEWLMQVGRLEHTRHLRIRVTGATSEPIDLTGPDRPDGAEAPAWFRWAAAPEPVAIEQPLPDGRRGALKVRIEANPDDELAEAWQETRAFLLLLLALAALVYVLVQFTVGRAFRSVQAILQGLEGIEQGDYGRRLPEFPVPEFARLAGAFNHMAEVLEQSRAENQALMRNSLRLQEDERRHLARELHDELGQSLTAIKAMAATLRLGDPGNREPADHILNLCDRSFAVFRGMMRRLRPGLLDELGLVASLEDLAEHWRLSHPELAVEMACDPAVDEDLGPARIQLFRIVQEGLTNVVRHAEARRVSISLQREEEGEGPVVVLRMRDDGRGFDGSAGQAFHRGFGLAGMRERVASLNGRFSLDARPGRGVAIEVRVPAGAPGP